MPTITDIYEIEPGDTLSKIAAKFGVSLQDLLHANQQIQNPNLIKVGQKVNIPGGAGRHNFNEGHVRNGFGQLTPLEFFSHE